MEKIKILNLFGGIGGNRKLWGDDHEITMIENVPEIAKIYQDFFPNDKVLVEDAHDYLLNHFEEFDFIWSSPPCPSHSRIRNVAGVGRGQNKPIYPDMELYEEIIFLNQVFQSSGTNFTRKYVVENVISYYKPLIEPQNIQRHYFWTNFYINPIEIATDNIEKGTVKEWEEKLGFSLENKNVDKKTVLRNCVNPELGLHIFQEAFREHKKLL